MDSGTTGSLESIVLAADVIQWTKSFLRGLAIDDTTLATDVIKEVGPGMQFLDHEHTLAHFRESLMKPYVMIRHGYEQWADEGARDYAAAAADTARRLLTTHKPLDLDPALAKELRRLAGSADGKGKPHA